VGLQTGEGFDKKRAKGIGHGTPGEQRNLTRFGARYTATAHDVNHDVNNNKQTIY